MEGLLRSSNVAFVKLGYERLQDKFLDYVKKFGFGESTGIALPGEASGVLKMKEPVEFATATFGQGPLAVTTLQQTAAYAAAANGGRLMKPHIFKALIDPDTGKVVQYSSPQMIRQVISEKTSEEVKADLEQVVSNQKIGTGKNAYLPGYDIAGKTGTANIVKEGEKTYSKDTWLTSFIGFAPVQDPKIVLAVVADQPDLGGDFHKGGEVAPVVFKEIMSQALPYLGVMPKGESNTPSVETNSTVVVPDLLGKSIAEAQEQLAQLGLHPILLGKGNVVRNQFPKPDTPIEKNQDVDMVSEDQIGLDDVPDLKGKSLRDVIDICTLLNIPYHISGDGYVVQQRIINGQSGNAEEFDLQP
jgi:penicillin-binding protein 2B